MWAAEIGYRDVVNVLLDAGAARDLENAIGETAIALAETAGRTAIISLFSACRPGQELVAGQSCELGDAGSFSVRSDGCLGDMPTATGPGGTAFGSLRFTVRDGESKTCIRGYVQTGGFRATEISNVGQAHEGTPHAELTEPGGLSDRLADLDVTEARPLRLMEKELQPWEPTIAGKWRIDAVP